MTTGVIDGIFFKSVLEGGKPGDWTQWTGLQPKQQHENVHTTE